MSLPKISELRDLLEWEPTHGVLSIYLHTDRGDRGGRWRIALIDALRDELSRVEQDGSRELQQAARATAERVLARYPEDARPPDGRGHFGLIEISSDEGRERWWSTQAAPRLDAIAKIAPHAHLRPLIEMLDDHRTRGVVAITGERARILEWNNAELSELDDREILTTGDWRERKAQRNYNPSSAQSPSSSGKDLHEQHLDHHRDKFVEEVASDLKEMIAERSWAEILCFGESKYLGVLEQALPEDRIAHHEEKNLVPEPLGKIEDRLRELTPGLNRTREIALIERAEEHALSGGRGGLGLSEVGQALALGRVEHLVLAADQLPERPDDELVEALALNGLPASLPTAELMIEQALQTDAKVTPVEGDAAERLSERGGIAAILRY